jgi:hypothetical protein
MTEQKIKTAPTENLGVYKKLLHNWGELNNNPQDKPYSTLPCGLRFLTGPTLSYPGYAAIKSFPKGTEAVVVFEGALVPIHQHVSKDQDPIIKGNGPLVILYKLPTSVSVNHHGYPSEELKLDVDGHLLKVAEVHLKEEFADWKSYAGNGLYYSIYYNHPVPLLYALGR